MKKIDFTKFKIVQTVTAHLQKKSQLTFTVGIVAILLLAICSEFFHSHEASMTPSKQTLESPDTVIPKGYVLVPIELKNADSLSALIENFAIVDLYMAGSLGKAKGQKVGHHLRLLRAPLNPNTFAVLVPDGEASTLISDAGPLTAVIQNRELLGHGSMEKSSKKISKVQYYLGG